MSKYIYDPSLVGKHRAFNKELFDKYDTPARLKVKKLLGDFVSDNSNQYEQDLIINDSECKYKYLELQVCPGWIGETYPYGTMTVYERKSKYDDNTLFLTLNHDLSKGCLFDIKSIRGKEPRRIKKYSREFVYDIPWCRVLQIPIEELTPDAIKLY